MPPGQCESVSNRLELMRISEVRLRRKGNRWGIPGLRREERCCKKQQTRWTKGISTRRQTGSEHHQPGGHAAACWNSANDFILYGKGGEFASNRLKDQEVLMLPRHLSQVSLVYVNTLMIHQVLAELA